MGVRVEEGRREGGGQGGWGGVGMRGLRLQREVTQRGRGQRFLLGFPESDPFKT